MAKRTRAGSNGLDASTFARSAAAEAYLSEEEFCTRYLVAQRTAQRWRATGIGGPPYVRLGLRRIGYRVSDCEAWAASRTFAHRAAEMAAA